MTAMQGQDLGGAVTSVALRTAGRSSQSVRDAMSAGEVVRSWPMRGTLHLVAAEDLGWMLDLTAPRIAAATATRRRALGIDDATLDRARAVLIDGLSGGRSLRRDDVMARWEDAGLLGVPQRGYHLLFHLAVDGVVCFGPSDGRQQRIVLCTEWIDAPRRLGRDEALAEWTLRYFRSHGPATIRDFAWWTKLTLRDARRGLESVRGELASMTVGDAEYWLDPRTPELLAALRTEARKALLLPGFDEYLLGYGDRSAVLPAVHAQRIVPGNNGMFLPTVVAGGEVVGTWRRAGSGRAERVETSAFDTLTGKAEREVARAAAALPAR